MSYIIHIRGNYKTTPSQWRWAIERLGREFHGVTELPVKSESITLEESENKWDIAFAGDLLIVVHTSASFNEVCALWAMTGTICDSITKRTSGEMLFGDEQTIHVKFAED